MHRIPYLTGLGGLIEDINSLLIGRTRATQLKGMHSIRYLTDRFLMAKCYNQRNIKTLRQYVTPAKAGVHFPKNLLDARLRGHDKQHRSV